jgi:hypothetical protein
MNRNDLTNLVKKEVDKFRGEDYVSLKAWVDGHRTEVIETVDDSGNSFQIELSATWDDKKAGSIRFWGCMTQSTTVLRSLFARDIVYTFIKRPDGSIID